MYRREIQDDCLIVFTVGLNGVCGFVDKGRPVVALQYGVKHWTHEALRGTAGEGARTVEEFLDGLDYVDERELVEKV